MSASIYAGKLRVRVAGLLVENGKLLLVKLHSPVSNSDIWTAPGGGVEFGETMEKALQREFLEETGLKIGVGELVYHNEVIQNNFHTIELYFRVSNSGGILKLGSDPEFAREDQILKGISFYTKEELTGLNVKPEFFKQLPWEKWAM